MHLITAHCDRQGVYMLQRGWREEDGRKEQILKWHIHQSKHLYIFSNFLKTVNGKLYLWLIQFKEFTAKFNDYMKTLLQHRLLF